MTELVAEHKVGADLDHKVQHYNDRQTEPIAGLLHAQLLQKLVRKSEVAVIVRADNQLLPIIPVREFNLITFGILV